MRFARFAQRVDHLSDSLASALELYRVRAESRFESVKTRLNLLSPYNTLERGYSLTVDGAGNVVKDASRVKDGEILRTRLAAGELLSRKIPSAEPA